MEENKIEVSKLQHIKFCGMISNNGSEKQGRKDYEINTTTNFIIDNNIRKTINNNNIHELLNLLYDDLIKKCSDIDHLGIWLTYDGKIIENAININTLNDMKELGADDVDPILEFCKMTIKPHEYIK